MDVKLIEYLTDLVARNPGQMTVDEYGEIATEIENRRGSNVLVFGCGRDSPLWVRANQPGRTIFVESAQRWAQHAYEAIKAEGLVLGLANIQLATYRTKLEDWQKDLNTDLSIEGLKMFPKDFDVIVVDAPPGAGKNAPGRLQSVYEASRRVAPGGVVFVHDMSRLVERECTKTLLVERAGMKMKRVTKNLCSFRRG